MQIGKDIDGERIKRSFVATGGEKPGKRVVAQIFEEQDAGFLVRGQNGRGAQAQFGQMPRHPYERTDVFLGRRGIHEDRPSTVGHQPTIAPKGGIAGKGSQIAARPPRAPEERIDELQPRGQ